LWENSVHFWPLPDEEEEEEDFVYVGKFQDERKTIEIRTYLVEVAGRERLPKKYSKDKNHEPKSDMVLAFSQLNFICRLF
jgi:hypothetical protein